VQYKCPLELLCFNQIDLCLPMIQSVSISAHMYTIDTWGRRTYGSLIYIYMDKQHMSSLMLVSLHDSWISIYLVCSQCLTTIHYRHDIRERSFGFSGRGSRRTKYYCHTSHRSFQRRGRKIAMWHDLATGIKIPNLIVNIQP
jgi:hypothetical protein